MRSSVLAEPARFHGERSLEIGEELGIGDFDLAYACDAQARAAAEALADPEDNEHLDGDLARV